ncbi:Serine/threonine-protein kinase psk1 [Golovinomyces cichoracearum]|uniref:Serine/threonine-protein kinase psk1 n=1 Tax=Golovinomyces cichoracearum TaxID=62708 RepID=A0A420IQE6_9PEZI|nr:Serine/threonine-protein kinase psk1 [Golovinomyces cichoracearum]
MQIEHEYSENLSLLTLMSAESIHQSSHQNYRSQIRSDAERRRAEDFNSMLSENENLCSRTASPSRRHKIQDIVSANSSPTLRPARHTGIGGISKLKLQLEEMNIQTCNRQNPSLHRSVLFPYQEASKDTSGETTTATSDAGFSDGVDEVSEISSCDIPLHDHLESTKSDFENPEATDIAEPTHQKRNRQISASDFETLRCLGKGTFGIVHLVKQHTTGRLYAQKQFKKASLTTHERLIQQTKTERSILESVNRHPFVVKLFYAFQDEEKLYLIIEYAQGGELFTHLTQARMFTEPVAAFYMAEMVLALDHLHRHLGIIYRDLKPENCLLDAEGHLLLTDFGLSKVSTDENDKCNSILGTVDYMAPEVVLGHRYGKSVDWWSFGALGFDLLTGSPPFKGQNHFKIQERIVKQKIKMPHFLSPDAKDLITRLLRKEPAKRLGTNMPKDMQTIRKHRFFRKINWELLSRREIEPPIRPLITDPELAENFASEFTDLPISPVVSRNYPSWQAKTRTIPAEKKLNKSENPFGGFSFMASTSLLEDTFGGGQFAGLMNEVEA